MERWLGSSFSGLVAGQLSSSVVMGAPSFGCQPGDAGFWVRWKTLREALADPRCTHDALDFEAEGRPQGPARVR